MNLNLSPLLKRLRADTSTDNEKASSTDSIAGSSSDGSDVVNDISKTFVNVFTDDILPEILDNLDILTAKDLLTFRLVNRSWRVAATSILLKRNLCQIAVNFGKLATDEDGKAVGKRVEDWFYERFLEHVSNSTASFTYFSANQPRNFLSDLTQLISTSPKFPSTSIRFRSDCEWTNLRPPSPHTFQHQADLLHFCTLYGMEIRKLSLSNGISRKALQNLLYVHMPNLACLDFKYLFHFSSQFLAQETREVPVCLPPPSVLKIKEIMVGTDEVFTMKKGEFMKELISVCPNLSAIHSVGKAALGVLLGIGKSHLIQDLTFGPEFCQVHTIRKFTKLLTETILGGEDRFPKLKLREFKVHFTNFKKYGFVWKAIHVILCASKDSLKSLQLVLCPSNHLLHYFVPPLPHLECLELTDILMETTACHRINFLGDVIGRAIQSGKRTADDVADEDFDALALQNQGNQNIPADYFPRLRKVKLVAGETTNEFTQLLAIFPHEHPGLGPDGVITVAGNALLTVTTLELNKFPSHDGNMSKLFPNVSHLSIFCNSSSHLRNWIWTAFPKLEIFEMSTNNFDWHAEKVDHFFTGISQESCANFDSQGNSSELDSDPVDEGLERTQPFIGDCENLKELKIKFRGKCGAQFASKVTAVHGFQKVIHRTKIIFSFESPKMSVEDMKETRRNLEPVAAYVEIRLQN